MRLRLARLGRQGLALGVTLAGIAVVAIVLWLGHDGPATTRPSTWRDPALAAAPAPTSPPEGCDWPSPPYAVSRPWLADREAGAQFWIDPDGAHLVLDAPDGAGVAATLTADADLSGGAAPVAIGGASATVDGATLRVSSAGRGEVGLTIPVAVQRLDLLVTDAAGAVLRPPLRVGEFELAPAGSASFRRCPP